MSHPGNVRVTNKDSKLNFLSKANRKIAILEGEVKETRTPGRGGSEYKRQLVEKQKLKRGYGVSEEQFRRFFALSAAKPGPTGDNLLAFLERRLDNVVFRLKMALSRAHARQMVVHGHFRVNGKKLTIPSAFVRPGDVVSLCDKTKSDAVFISAVLSKRYNLAIKVADWLELDEKNYSGKVLRLPERADIATKSETNLIVESYSK